MARPLTGQAPTASRMQRRERRTLGLIALAVALLHALALLALRGLLQPPSLLAEVVAPMYTRTLVAQAAAPLAEAAAPAPPAARPHRPSARIVRPHKAARARARQGTSSAAADHAEPATAVASAAQAAASAALAAADAEANAQPDTLVPATPPTLPASAPEATAAAAAPADGASGPEPPASASAPAWLDGWPADTRLSYQLGGNYRGELHGNAQVLWQREGTRYQAVVQLDVGLLLSSRFTSQGRITAQGLAPEVYEEQVRQRRRGVRLGDDTVRLDKGQTVPRPDQVQDTASQFIELGHRFATGQLAPAPGTSVRLWLARPGGVDEWTYDVVGVDTLQLPRLGAVAALHLVPRPLDKPRGPIQAEIWIAPTLQYLPVRIRLTQGPDTWMDLTVEAIEQQ